MKIRFLAFILLLFMIPLENMAAPNLAESHNNNVEFSVAKKKSRYKKKEGFFKRIFKKNKCKCPKH